ncbi:hypothetical protein GCM10014713_32830 [Streptomyces purpureus]|uniref:Uncharacterized protein n=1 Tax=Streptomyces purpureus TaxID=1951 RepID=A0A918LQQ5_9ACTN|nr:hypothetical protein GCM10014713_32830 [Streptomyces purpureus]
MSDKTCGSRVWLNAAQVTSARRFLVSYAGELSQWAVCAKPPHNRDQDHMAIIRNVPDDWGGGYVVLRWGRYWRFGTAGRGCARAALFHWPAHRTTTPDRGERADG